MNLLGIDGGKRSPGLAWFQCGQFLRIGDHTLVPDVIVFERPVFYPKDPPGKVPALITLSIATGRLIERYALNSCPVIEEVEARTWKGNVPKSVTQRRALKRLTKTEKARLAIDLKCIPARNHNDQYDAIGLCLWWLEKEGLR